MSPEVLGIVISLLSVLVGWFLGQRSVRASQEQYRLEARAFATDWYDDLRDWASEAIDVMSEALYYYDASVKGGDHAAALLAARHRLSALIDRGRFFLPNELSGDHGMEKPAAYRGYRHPALDYLVATEQLIAEDIDLKGTPYSSKVEALIGMKREFVSVIQVILDPRTHLSEIDRLLQASRAEPSKARPFLASLFKRRYRRLG